jgi:recombination protein RecA
MSQACRKLSPLISRSGGNAFFVNQIREKIGVMWGSPETTSGGRALKFFASVRIDIRKTGNEKDGDEDVVGSVHKLKIVKNKVAPPFKICELLLNFENGFDKVENLFYAAANRGLIEKSGNTYTFDKEQLGVGQKKAIKGLKKLGQETIDKLYRLTVGKITKADKEAMLPPEIKEKLAELEKRLAETKDEEEKKKIQEQIDKINSGEIPE